MAWGHCCRPSRAPHGNEAVAVALESDGFFATDPLVDDLVDPLSEEHENSSFPRVRKQSLWSELERMDEFIVQQTLQTLPGVPKEDTISATEQFEFGTFNEACVIREHDTSAKLGFMRLKDDINSKALVEDLQAPQESPNSLRATSDEQVPSEITVRICKGDSRLNMDIDYGDGETLEVTGLQPGLVTEWNNRNPLQQLAVGDRIVEINGVSMDSNKLLEEVKSADTLEMRVCKSVRMSA
mmetsp:Transcript_17894/g.32471  ORF Transcript_17894/g.32471 Transcript_17894/m.32471 type:complete len:240 (-) Transcript_17894:123-842(-)